MIADERTVSNDCDRPSRRASGSTARPRKPAEFYVSIFRNSRVTSITRNGEAGPGPSGSAPVVGFELDGHSFRALNGGPQFTFNEAVSLVVNCTTQNEVKTYWEKLTTSGGSPGQYGWLKDKFG